MSHGKGQGCRTPDSDRDNPALHHAPYGLTLEHSINERHGIILFLPGSQIDPPKKQKEVDLRGIEPLTSRMRSERSTPELQAQVDVISRGSWRYIYWTFPRKFASSCVWLYAYRGRLQSHTAYVRGA